MRRNLLKHIGLLSMLAIAVLHFAQTEEAEDPLLASKHDVAFIFNSRETPTEPNSAEMIFDEVGRNPGSASHPNAPGRVRADAPAQHELAAEYTRSSDGMLTGRQPEPFIEPDPRFHEIIRMSDDTRSDDFPAIQSHPKDRREVWMAWVSYSGRRDQIRLSRRGAETGNWGTWNLVPGVTGDVWRPSLAFDGHDRLWVVWSQQELFEADFDLYARWFDGKRWGPRQQLTSSPEGDFDQSLARAPDGTPHLCWQSFRGGQSDIFYLRFDGQTWSRELRLSERQRNDWAPSIGVDSNGVAHVAWDTYHAGNYDVVMRSLEPGHLGPIRPVAASALFEARASLAVDGQDRVWVAYEVGESSWGKDQGQLVDRERTPGSMLNLERQVKVRVMGNSILEAEPPVASLFPPRRWRVFVKTDRPHLSHPTLFTDGKGRVHLVVRKTETPTGGGEYWRPYLLTVTSKGWSQPVPVPYSVGRLSMFVSSTPDSGTGFWLAWPRDNQPTYPVAGDFPEETVIENVYAARYEPQGDTGSLLRQPFEPDFAARSSGHKNEAADVSRIRSWRARVHGRNLQILRGDTHRHTELSMDLRGAPDGSILDFYRYMLDAASMDFGLITDHQYGTDREYWWWLEEKLADLFHAPERYVAMFGYERSVRFPDGHRNVIHDRRGFEPFPFLQPVTAKYRSHTGVWDDISPDDTKRLYETVRRSGGVTIPHTSGTNMGTDWRDNDSEVETLVEIFQGDRHSYEAPGAPLTDTAAHWDVDQPMGIRPEGFVSNAWAKGYRIGVIASSDHASTHISYALVWAESRSRHAVLEAMKKRRAYAATDNIVLEFWLGDHFMGEEFRSESVPPIRVKAAGTNSVAEVEIIRNNAVVYRSQDLPAELEFTYQDLATQSGTLFYYVRLVQVDGQTAWSSPIWIRLEAKR